MTLQAPTAECEACGSADCQDCENNSPYCHLPHHHYVRFIDEKATRNDAVYRANIAMRSDYNARPSADVQDGYRTAFVDVALGGTGIAPPVPPERYWGTCYRTAEGHARAQAWFSGYERGAARALASCRSQFNIVPSAGKTALVDDTVSTTAAAPGVGTPWNTGW